MRENGRKMKKKKNTENCAKRDTIQRKRKTEKEGASS